MGEPPRDAALEQRLAGAALDRRGLQRRMLALVAAHERGEFDDCEQRCG